MAIALGCLQEHKGNTQLLKTSCTFDTRLGRFELDVTWKPPPYGPASIEFEVAMQTPNGAKTTTILPIAQPISTQ